MAADRSTAAFQGFLVEAKQYWMSDVWTALKEDYARRSGGKAVSSSSQVAALMEQSPTYWFYSWLERHIQRAKYSGRYGLHKMDAPVKAPAPRPKLREVPVPAYYSAVDTHQHPGNLTGAPNAGLVYKASAQSTQPGATNRYGLHERFARFVGELGDFKHILEMGCGFGKSALPLAQKFARADVKAIDLSAPCLELAAAEAAQAKVSNVSYEQADLRHTGYRDGEFDLVTSTMVLHELDTPALRESLQEAHRLLAPGGILVHLDFRVKDPFLEFIHYGHARRNNEPYMPEINELDLEGELRGAGFRDVKITPFEEVDGATRPDWPTWRFPWTAFVARKP
jgi:SAM-dependent methyltransferase